MKIALLLLSIISVNIYSMKRGPSEDKPTDEGRDMQQDTIKKKRIKENACSTNREVQDGALYNHSLSEDLVKAVETGNESDVRKLLQAEADPNAKNSEAIPCLCSAAQKGYKEIVELLIAHGADVNAQTSKGRTALMYAAYSGHKEIVETLIAHRAHVNAQTSTGYAALMYAASKGHKEIVELLIAHGAQTGITALINAVSKGHKEIVEALIAHGTNVNAQDSSGKTALMDAASKGHKEIVGLLIAHGADINTQTSNGSTALIWAVAKGHKEIVEMLIAHGAHVNAQDSTGYTALMFAAQNGHKEIVEMLIAHGTNVNAQDSSGSTALTAAAKEGHKEIVELLIAHGAHVNAQDSTGITALIDAACDGHKEIVEMLIAHDTNVNAQTSNGSTALMGAALEGHKEIVETLITHGTKVNAQTSKGSTTLMYAASKGHKEIVEMLIAHGAHVNARNSSGKTALMQVSKPEIVALLLKHSAEFTSNDRQRILLQLNRNAVLRENCDMLLFSCSTMPELQLYRNEPLSYTRWHKVHCLEKSRYIRLCESNRSQVNYLLMQEPGHNQCLMQETDHNHHNQCSHQTVLLWASMLGHKEALEKLLTAHLPLWYLNAQDKDGRTALIYAIIYGHTGIVPLLVQAYEKNVEDAYLAQESETDPTKKSFLMKELEKAKRAINISDNKGKSALVYALEKENKEIAHRLLQAGARPSLTLIKKLAENNYALATRLLVSFSYTAEGKRRPLLL